MQVKTGKHRRNIMIRLSVCAEILCFHVNCTLFCVLQIHICNLCFKSWTPEEKPVPKKLHTSMLAAFQKSDREPEVKLRRAKSEKQVRPKSVGNVDLLRWQDDASIRSSSATSKKGKTGKQSRPKSIAFQDVYTYVFQEKYIVCKIDFIVQRITIYMVGHV